MFDRLIQFIGRFRRDPRGGVAIMAGLTVGLIGTGVIAAVDISDMNVTKQKMQDRLDSAVLFATLHDEFRDPKFGTELQDAGHAFVTSALKNSGIRAENVTTKFTYDAENDRIIGEINFTPPAIFVGSIVAPRGMTVRAAAAPADPTKMEIALVLDISGSMNWSITSNVEAPTGSRRIDALRDGVETLVSALDKKPAP